MDGRPPRGHPAAPLARRRLGLYLKGLAMGLGDAVPGVSGGTIAVLTGVYGALVRSIRAVDGTALRLLARGRMAALWERIDGGFLSVLALGVLSGLLLSANTALYLLDRHPEALMAFFIGLVLAGAWLLGTGCGLRRWPNLLACALGAGLVASTGLVAPGAPAASHGILFLSGALAACAMLLPGLSGAYILLLLGMYRFVLEAFTGFRLGQLAVFAAGCALGLALFSRLAAWLLLRHRRISHAAITGMLLGSVWTLWPWRRAVGAAAPDGRHPARTVNVLPSDYLEATGNDPALAASLLCAAFGAALVPLLRRVAGTEPGA